MPPIIDENKCKRCNTCADICPTGVFFGSKKGEIPVAKYEEECWHCNACVVDCPANAVELRIPLPAMILYVDAVKK